MGKVLPALIVWVVLGFMVWVALQRWTDGDGGGFV